VSRFQTLLPTSTCGPTPWKESLGDYWKARLVIADANIKDLQAQAEVTLRVIDAAISVKRTVADSVGRCTLTRFENRVESAWALLNLKYDQLYVFKLSVGSGIESKLFDQSDRSHPKPKEKVYPVHSERGDPLDQSQHGM